MVENSNDESFLDLPTRLANLPCHRIGEASNAISELASSLESMTQYLTGLRSVSHDPDLPKFALFCLSTLFLISTYGLFINYVAQQEEDNLWFR